MADLKIYAFKIIKSRKFMQQNFLKISSWMKFF